MIPATMEATVMVEPAQRSAGSSSTNDGGLVKMGEMATSVLMGPVEAAAVAVAVVTMTPTKPAAVAVAALPVVVERSRLEVVLMVAAEALGFSESTQI